tara:strand:- start:559 stop:3051 length:2493 start_codon:yes stop_codon:yes gene_type:complete
MELNDSQKQEVFDAYMTGKGLAKIKRLLKESGMRKPIEIRNESNRLNKLLVQEFAQNPSYLKQYIEDNNSSNKEDEGAILLNQDGKMILQPNITELNTRDTKIDEMAERMPDGFKQSFGDNIDMMLSQILVEYGDAKKPKTSGITQIAKTLKNNFRVKGRVMSDEIISRMLIDSKGIPDKVDVSLSMGKGKQFQTNKARILPMLQTVPSEYEQAVAPFLRKLDETTGMSPDKELFKFSAGTLIGEKNLKFAEDRKDVYRYWADINSNYVDFQNALDALVSLDMPSLKSLKPFKDKDLNYIYEFKPGDSAYEFASQITRVFESLDKIVDELEDYQRVDRRVTEADQGFSGIGTEQVRTDAERTGVGFRVDAEVESEIAELDEATQAFDDAKMDLKEVDPLYKYILDKKRNLFNEPAILQSEIDEFRKLTKKGITYVYDLDFDESITDWLESLAKTAGDVPDGDLYLPMNDVLSSLTTKYSSGEISQKKKLIADFLDAVSKIVMVEEPTGAIRDRLVNLASFEGKEGTIPSGAKGKFDELVKQISKFFFVPLTSSYYPFADKLDFRTEIDSNTERLFAIITSKNTDITENAYLSIINQELQDAAFIDITIVEDIAELLEEATSPDAKADVENFKGKLEQLHAMLIPEVFKVGPDSAIGEEGKEELGEYFRVTLENNNVDTEGMTIFDEPLDVWDTGDSGPIRSVINHILRREDSYRALDDEESVTTFGKAIDRLKAARDSMQIIKSDLELDLLQTHDSIRKMLGKPVYYNTSKLDNFEHVNTAMSMLKEEYNLDVSAIEVENIVNDFGAMEDIATKHGVSPESVYFLKGNFR